jgi:hypothetical protein
MVRSAMAWFPTKARWRNGRYSNILSSTGMAYTSKEFLPARYGLDAQSLRKEVDNTATGNVANTPTIVVAATGNVANTPTIVVAGARNIIVTAARNINVAGAGDVANTPTIVVAQAGDIVVADTEIVDTGTGDIIIADTEIVDTGTGDIIIAGTEIVDTGTGVTIASAGEIVHATTGVTIASAPAFRIAGAGDVGFARTRRFLLRWFVNDGQVNFEILVGDFDHSLKWTRIEPVRGDHGHTHDCDFAWRQVG